MFNESEFYTLQSLPTSPNSNPTSQIPIHSLISASQSCSFPTSQSGTQSSSTSISLPESSSTPQSTSLSLPHSPHQLFSIPSPPITQSSPNSVLVSHLSVPYVSVIPQVPVPAPSSINTHPMITRSKDGIFKPKALAAQLSHDQSLSDHSALVVSTVKAAKHSKIKSVSKIDYTITEPPSYKVAA